MARRRISNTEVVLFLTALFFIACGRSEHASPSPVSSVSSVSSASVGRVEPIPLVADVDPHARRRAECAFGAGAKPKDTLDTADPVGSKIPIEHIVVVLQENHSFDQYFQKLPEYGQPAVDVAPADYENPDPSGQGDVVAPFLSKEACSEDVPHNWVAVHHQINDGKMNGFLSAANPGGRRALGYYDATTLPFYYALANTFGVGDRYFAAIPGPTYPNRMFFLAASSFGHTENVPPPPRDEERTLFHQLEKKGFAWSVYSEGPTFEENMFPRLHAEKGEHFRTVEEFFVDAKKGTLPFFSWVESSFGGSSPTDEHSPGNVQVGEAFVARVIGALFKSANWKDSALFLTYDEHGGYFDHVPPPRACAPDDLAPVAPGARATARFDSYGVRVPFVVVSPYARPHFVSHERHSHTSVLRFVQARAELPALTRRDANAEPPFEFFDFSHPSFVTPPTLPSAVVDADERTRCVHFAESQAPQEHKHPTPAKSSR